MSGRVALTIVLALTAAFLDALSNVLEIAEAEKVPDDQALHASLIMSLARRPKWLIGLACDAGGFAAMAAALSLGAVAFVQPILSLALLMSLQLGSLLQRRTFRRNDWFAAGVLCAGLAAFLYEVPPRGGHQLVPADRWAIAGPAIAGAAVLCVLVAQLLAVPRAVPRSRGIDRVHDVGGSDEGVRALPRARGASVVEPLGSRPRWQS